MKDRREPRKGSNVRVFDDDIPMEGTEEDDYSEQEFDEE
jgi:hypothetical protein